MLKLLQKLHIVTDGTGGRKQKTFQTRFRAKSFIDSEKQSFMHIVSLERKEGP